ncbi:MAG: Uma2 family endonuclease, partial [Acidobacteriota bacterium]|nr:Uma2 family endonuclease [Acidobacteriota bacterium]
MTTPAPHPTHSPSPTPPPPHLPARRVLTMDDLPSEFEDEEALPSEFHLLFALLLYETFRPTTVPPDQYFCAIDLYLYCLHEGVVRGLRPNWMGVVGVPALYRGERTRASYVVEDEGRAPLIIVEALSPQTRRNDLAEYGRGAWAEDRKLLRKWDIYESVLKVPYYVTIDDRREAIRWFRHDGARYVEERPAGER